MNRSTIVEKGELLKFKTNPNIRYKELSQPFEKKNSNASSIYVEKKFNKVNNFSGPNRKKSTLIFKGEQNPNIEINANYFGEIKENDTHESNDEDGVTSYRSPKTSIQKKRDDYSALSAPGQKFIK